MDDDMQGSPVWGYIFWLFILGFIALFCYLGYDNMVNLPKRQAARQLQLDTFYTAHACRPEGYVATRSEAIRTYRCDNGLYITEDMK